MNSLMLVLIITNLAIIFFLVLNAVLQIKVKNIAEVTHMIVNSQRSGMQTAISLLTQRIADENPNDIKAQEAARRAVEELEMMDKPRRFPI